MIENNKQIYKKFPYKSKGKIMNNYNSLFLCSDIELYELFQIYKAIYIFIYIVLLNQQLIT